MNSPILQKIINARKILVLDHPFWGNLALRLILKEDPTCKTGWTDGKTLGYNPNWVGLLSDKQTVGFCAHEVCHPMCQHHTRRAGRNHSLWQKAGDYVVNSILLKAGFILPKPHFYDPRFDGMSTDEVFKILEEEREEARRQMEKELEKQKRDGDTAGNGDNDRDRDNDGDGDNAGNGKSGDDEESKEPEENGEPKKPEESENDEDDDPDPGNCGEVRDHPGKDESTSPSSSELKQAEQEQKIAVAQAANQAKNYGDLPAGLDREIQNILEPKVDPKDLLQRFVAMNAKNDFAWMPPNRRYIYQGLYMPSLKSEELGTVMLVLDSSGSIGQKELDNFSSIVSAILETYTIDAIILYCDTMIYEPEYYKREDLPLKLKVKGGGGTDFIPPFLFVEENNIIPVCLIYLTDLECDSYPEVYPDYPVMWVSTTPEDKLWWGKPPFGEIIYMDLEENL